MRQKMYVQLFLIFLLASLFPTGKMVSAGEPIVHAVLFFSPSCPHCHKIITEDLPPIMENYGDQLVILGINTYTEEGHELFVSAIRRFNVAEEMAGVPMLIIGETALIGSLEIPQQLPGIVSGALGSGGMDWPDIPGLAQVLEDQEAAEAKEDNPQEAGIAPDPDAENQANNSTADTNQDEGEVSGISPEVQSTSITSNMVDSIAAAQNMTMVDRFMQDKTANLISTLVLSGMILSLGFAGAIVFQNKIYLKPWPNWVAGILLIIGFLVAAYMGYVEITRSEAVCGPVGDCNTVQQSPYASLFGLIPIGLLGVLGYISIGILWLISISGGKKSRSISMVCLWGLLLIGTNFSIYLTFLEPFVIGATCAWCLTSAVVMTLLFWISTVNIHQNGGLRYLRVIGK